MPIFSEAQADAIAKTFHKDTISIFPPFTKSKGTVDSSFNVVYGAETARYENVAAHVQPMLARRQTEVGGADVLSEEISVKCAPHSIPDTQVGDRVQIVSSEDSALTGQSLVVVRVEARTAALTRNLVCRLATAGPTPGSA